MWTVEFFIVGSRQDLERFRSILNSMLSRLAATRKAGTLLRAMPAIELLEGDEGPELRLRWVALHARAATDALAQASSQLAELADVVQLPDPTRLRAAAWAESEANDGEARQGEGHRG